MGPETGLRTKLQHGPKSTQEMGLNYLSPTKMRAQKKGTTMGFAHGARSRSTSWFTKVPSPYGPLGWQGQTSEPGDNSQKAESSAPTLPGLDKLIQLLGIHQGKEKHSHTNTPMPVLLALLTALTSAN